MALTRSAFVAYVALGALALVFCPAPLRPLRDIGAVLCLAWLANHAFSLWEDVGWARRIVNIFLSMNGRSSRRSSRDQEISVPVIAQRLGEWTLRAKPYAIELGQIVRTAVLRAILIVEKFFGGFRCSFLLLYHSTHPPF